MFQPFEFQRVASDNLLNAIYKLQQNNISDGYRSVLLQSATGSGKTVIASDLISNYSSMNEDHKILILLNRQILIGQTYDTLKAFDVKCSVLHDEVDRNLNGERFPSGFTSNVVLTMPETFLNTKSNSNKLEFDHSWIPSIILIDEAHQGTSSNYQLIRDLYPDAIIVGLTATPYREKSEDGEHLHQWYKDNIIFTISVQELINLKRLVQPLYFEYKEGEDIVVEVWKKHTENYKNKRTIHFTRNTEESLAYVNAYRNAGISVELVTAGSDICEVKVASQSWKERQEIFNRFRSGETSVLVSVDALSTGFDVPNAQFCILTRGIGNISLYYQIIGRVLRAHPEKEHAVILDFCGNGAKYVPIEHYEWDINDLGKAVITDVRGSSTISSSLLKKSDKCVGYCDKCNHVFDMKSHITCPLCGKKHSLKVSDTVPKFIESIFDRKWSSKEYEELLRSAGPYFDKRASEEIRIFTQRKLAGKFGIQFNPDGTFKSEFAVLEQILKGRYEWSPKIKYGFNI